MIYTVTLNPAIDYYISMNEFNEGELNSIENGYTLPGGKGINVSKVLKNFGVESTAPGICRRIYRGLHKKKFERVWNYRRTCRA